MDEIKVIENNGQRVLTTAQIAEQYGTNNDVITKNFSRNSDRYVEGKHYYCLKGNELKTFRANGQFDGLPSNLNKLYLWTEKGALLHAKSLNTDKAWEVYDALVENYFNPKQNISMTPLEMIASMASESVKLEKRISDLESRIDDVQTNAIKSTLEHGTINYSMQKQISHAVGLKTIQVLKTELAINKMGKKIMARIYQSIQNKFNVTSYKNLMLKQFVPAITYIECWEPDNKTLGEVLDLYSGMPNILNELFDRGKENHHE